ncbi:MAG TPA: hypothetical protein VKE27_11830 [Candidatus Dormibacteraeota bacterium]|nr:hypothetical protein [Candidatus Dormibacteraeota bacterium]
MKRKRPEHEERRRPMAELNMADEPRRIDVRRKGCGPLSGSVFLLVATAVALAAGLR